MRTTSYSNYEREAIDIAKQLNVKLSVIGEPEYRRYFADDKEPRFVFKLKLTRGKKCYTFNFGQSIVSGSKKPTMYDVLSCLQKYDVGSFEDFCSEFGYDTDSRKAERIYKALCKEYEAMCRLFSDEELELLSEIA
jgi:hypothetical protein